MENYYNHLAIDQNNIYIKDYSVQIKEKNLIGNVWENLIHDT